MRFTLSYLLMALAASVPAVHAERHRHHHKMKCETIRVAGTRTRTKMLPTHTCHKTVTVRPIATAEVTHTPRTRTRTKVVVTIATQTVSANARTNAVLSTSTKFDVLVPTTTLTLAPYKPTSTVYTILPATTTIKTTVTSYTANAPAPTLAKNKRRQGDDADAPVAPKDGVSDDATTQDDKPVDAAPKDDVSTSTVLNDSGPDAGATGSSDGSSSDDDSDEVTIFDLFSDGSSAEGPMASPNGVEDPRIMWTLGSSPVPISSPMMNFDGFAGRTPGAESGTDASAGGIAARRAHRGKQVLCTPKVKVTATVTKPAQVTVTHTKRAKRPVVTTTSTATGTVTSTLYPAEVTSIVRRVVTQTLTAKPITQTFKPTLAAVTQTKTLNVHADPPRQTTVVDLYKVCKPANQIDLLYWKRSDSTQYQSSFSTGTTSNAALCCQSVADTPGAVSWAWVADPPTDDFVRGTCYGLSLNGAFDSAHASDMSRQCVASNPGSKVPKVYGTAEKGGLLQCGSSFA